MGNPLRFLLTSGQQQDITQADDLIADFDFERVIADRSYDANDFLKKIAEKEAEDEMGDGDTISDEIKI